MSKIDAETLGDAAVGAARDALEKVLGSKGTGDNGTIKKLINDLQAQVNAFNNDGIDKDAVKAITNATSGTLKVALDKIKADPTYENLSDVVKKELTALESVVTNLATATEGLSDTKEHNKTGGASEDKANLFIEAFNEFDKVYTSLSDLNAAQTADLNEMRTKLQSFVASPEDAKTKLDSTNFTAFIDTLDTALSKISDQRAKLREYIK